MITANVIQRTFHILSGDFSGTAFTIDIDERQYLITAKHLIEDMDGNFEIRIFHDGDWKDIPVTLVGHCKGKIDISVLATKIRLSPSHPLTPSSAGMALGQDVYFLGFPYGLGSELGQLNRNFPVPFVKKAIVSSFVTGDDGIQFVFLDGHNNPGFSGGPVVFKNLGESDYNVAGVISGFRYEKEQVYEDESEERERGLFFKYNTGLVISHEIRHAKAVIEANPIGCRIKS